MREFPGVSPRPGLLFRERRVSGSDVWVRSHSALAERVDGEGGRELCPTASWATLLCLSMSRTLSCHLPLSPLLGVLLFFLQKKTPSSRSFPCLPELEDVVKERPSDPAGVV